MTSVPLARSRPVVAIDGPAGAGKSTVAAHLASRFGFLNLETGAMYRALAFKALVNKVDPNDETSLLSLVAVTSIALDPSPEGNRVLLDGVVVTEKLREPEVTAAASRVSVHGRVRQWMVEQQRVLGASGGVVMEGRDIGTVVFPDAEVKIFLDASAEVRGARRFEQAGPTLRETRTEVLRELQERDERDRNRAESPLRPAPDAVLIDSSQLTLPELLKRAEELVAEWSNPVNSVQFGTKSDPAK